MNWPDDDDIPQLPPGKKRSYLYHQLRWAEDGRLVGLLVEEFELSPGCLAIWPFEVRIIELVGFRIGDRLSRWSGAPPADQVCRMFADEIPEIIVDPPAESPEFYTVNEFQDWVDHTLRGGDGEGE